MEAILALDREVQMRMCREVLRSVAAGRRPNAHWFRNPVDLEENPDYLDFIGRPMDFRTISSKLNNNMYRSATEFNQDVLLVFQNCYAYNPEDHEAYEAALNLEDVFNKKWLKLAADSRNFRTKSLTQNNPDNQGDDESDESIQPYPTRRSTQNMRSNQNRQQSTTRTRKSRLVRKCHTNSVGYTKQALLSRPPRKVPSGMSPVEQPRTEEPILGEDESPPPEESGSPDEPTGSEHTGRSSPVSETSTAVENLESGTSVMIELGVTRILGVVRRSVAYSRDPAKKDLYQLNPVGDEGPVDRRLIVGVEDLSKTEYQMGEEVITRIKLGTQEMRVKTHVEAIRMIEEVVHYDVEVQGQIATVTGDELE